MSYSIIGIISIVVHLIINRDILWHGGERTIVPAYREYRDYILGMLVFCVTDVLWGFLNEWHLIMPLYAVTVLFFMLIMVGFWLWSRYVTAYVEGNHRSPFRNALLITGMVLLCCEIVILIINFFVPIQFMFDEKDHYHAGRARYVTLGLQVILFLLTSVYTFVTKAYSEQATRRVRYAFGLFGVLMTTLIILQLYYPMLPLYSIGYLLSSCMLHSFIVEDEKDEYRRNLEQMLHQLRQKDLELGDVRRKIYTDPLTGVGSKQAYIYNASMLISEFFDKSPVYRVGGDEFVVIIEGEAFKSRREQLAAFEQQVENNLRSGKLVVSSGMAEYIRGTDRSYHDIFERADTQMYQRKNELKQQKKNRV